MKRKVIAIALSLGIFSLGAFTINASYSAGGSKTEAVGSNVNESGLNAVAAVPEVALASAVSKATFYVTEAYKANKDALNQVLFLGSLFGTEVVDTNLQETDEIFDN
ncbi:hypothetical protein ACFSVM_23880 [Paenibacillus shunpengii]|uniref:Uncharacterized protein n=1 Tax=Paenibacillus shunpengii TaxID=2054424 RepID=A0ABW5SUM0_9BACL|nr:hypothetical protein [Paenibacillus sp. FSL H7-0326]OMC66266.1 hypothetical protein BK126_19780 [Paenibacillus sp. FSL H7-0326]